MPDSRDATQLLAQVRDGDENAVDALFAVVYDELHGLANNCLRGRQRGNTLQPTALVHEAYLRLIRQDLSSPAADRKHFLALAARAMRAIIVDHARARYSQKRGGGRQRVPLDDALAQFEDRCTDLLALDEALTELSEMDPRQSRIVELRFFGGLNEQEVAELLSVSLRTVEREWRFARAWLLRAIDRVDAHVPIEHGDE